MRNMNLDGADDGTHYMFLMQKTWRQACILLSKRVVGEQLAATVDLLLIDDGPVHQIRGRKGPFRRRMGVGWLGVPGVDDSWIHELR